MKRVIALRLLRPSAIALSLLLAQFARAQFAETVPPGSFLPAEDRPEFGPDPLIILPDIRSGDSDWFTIIAPDGPSAGFLQRAASNVEDTLQDELALPKSWNPRSYVLLAEGRSPDKPGYWTEKEPNSPRFNAVVAWEKMETPAPPRPGPGGTPAPATRKPLTPSQIDALRSLTRASLQRWITETKGPEAARFQPRWLEWGLAEAARRIDDQFNARRLRREAGDTAIPLARLLSNEQPKPEEAVRFAAQCFWLIQWIKADSGHPAIGRDRLATLAATDQPLFEFSRIRPDEMTSEADLELWWAVGFNTIATYSEYALLSPAETREIVLRSALFDVNDGNGDLQVNLVELWNTPRSAATDLLILARIRSLKFDLRRGDPLYQNPIISLGRTLEAFLTRDTKALDTNYRLFLEDLKVSDQLVASGFQIPDEATISTPATSPAPQK